MGRQSGRGARHRTRSGEPESACAAAQGSEPTAEERGTIAAVDDAISKPDRQLLVLDFDGEHPKVAVASGNVDTAEHVYPMQIKDGAMRDMWLSKTERT